MLVSALIGPAGLAPSLAPESRRAQRGPRHTLLRANHPKGWDAEPRDYSETDSPRPPGRQRTDLSRGWRLSL